MKNIVIIVLALLFFSCGSESDTTDCHSSVAITNKSNKAIYFYAGSLPETNYNPIRSGEYFKIVPGATKYDPFGRDRGCYEELFAENNKLYYSIFDEQVLLENSWEDVVSKNLVSKRYIFTLQEMQAVNWEIIYTGD